jgi:mRNA interferase YafQ
MNKYGIVATKRYKKDYRRIVKAGLDVRKLERIIDVLAAGDVLPDANRDHALKGKLQGTRECHVAPDWVLRYAKDEDCLVLLLVSTGDHRRTLGIE